MGTFGGAIRTLTRLERDGLVRPPARTLRYRRREYAGRSFYQWWYFAIKDLQEDRYFAFHLNPVVTIHDHSRRGTYLTFSMIERAAETRFHRTERHPLDAFSAADGNGSLPVGMDHAESMARIETDEAADRIELSARLGTADSIWFGDGTFEGAPLDEDASITIELTIHRLYGWYAQHDMEQQMERDGLTMWNTYAHTAEVEGTITVGDRSWTITRSPRFRAYCDMNWGSQLLHGRPPRAHPWGWFYVGLPWNEDEEGEEVALIAGTGRSEDTVLQPFLGPLGFRLAFEGKFADVELGGGRRAGVREVDMFRRLLRGPDDEWHASRGLPLVRTASDGRHGSIEVFRDQWTRWVDPFGEAWLPLSQLVRVRTGKLEATLHFTCEPEDCNRLLFPQEDGVFSDFEALGARCSVLIVQRDEPPGWGFAAPERVLADFETNDAGLEFGYLAPGSVG